MQATQVDPSDNAYLALDGATTTGNISLVLMLDGTAELDQVRRQVRAALPAVPEFRRRLHPVALGLDRPWWVDDAGFELDRHVVEQRLPAGDDRSVALAAAQVAQRVLDRDRPLWSFTLLQIPADAGRPARSALVTRVHHAISDGARYREILQACFGPGPAPGADDWTPEPVPPEATLLARSAQEASAWAARSLVESGQALAAALREPPAWPPATPSLQVAPRTPLNRAVTGDRTFAFGSLDVAASKPVRTRHRATVNDVFHASVAAALRAWLGARNVLPATPLVALFPISQRHLTEDQSGANRIGITSCVIPTHLADPLERLRAAHEGLEQAKGTPLMDERTMATATRALAPLLAPLAQLSTTLRMADTMPSPFNLLVSNVPLGDAPLQIGTGHVERVHPMPPIFDGLGVNITAHGYRGRLHVGIFACPQVVPDPWELWEPLRAAYEQVCQL